MKGFSVSDYAQYLAPQDGFEPPTQELTAPCSATELLGNDFVQSSLTVSSTAGSLLLIILTPVDVLMQQPFSAFASFVFPKVA